MPRLHCRVQGFVPGGHRTEPPALGPNDHRLVAPLITLEDLIKDVESPPHPFRRGPFWQQEVLEMTAAWVSALRSLLRASPVADLASEVSRLRALVNWCDTELPDDWRTCVFCDVKVEGYARVCLDRPCGHQAHPACVKTWSGQFYEQGVGVLCPRRCACRWARLNCCARWTGSIAPRRIWRRWRGFAALRCLVSLAPWAAPGGLHSGWL